jgi:hypothetical protein
MRAVRCLDGNLEVVDADEPQPQKGQLVPTCTPATTPVNSKTS